MLWEKSKENVGYSDLSGFMLSKEDATERP